MYLFCFDTTLGNEHSIAVREQAFRWVLLFFSLLQNGQTPHDLAVELGHSMVASKLQNSRSTQNTRDEVRYFFVLSYKLYVYWNISMFRCNNFSFLFFSFWYYLKYLNRKWAKHSMSGTGFQMSLAFFFSLFAEWPDTTWFGCRVCAFWEIAK